MDVIIDARMVTEQLHGIARYTYEIVNYMLNQKDINISILVNDIEKSKTIFNDKNLRYIELKSKFLSPLEQFELPFVLNKYSDKNSLFHSPSFVSSPFIRCNMVMTIHDLNHIRFPQYYTILHKYYYKYIVKSAAKKCGKILTVSNFSKKEIIDWLKCDEDKVIVTYNGIDDKFRIIEEKEILRKAKIKYKLPDKFILYIGNLKPHKNVETLIKSISLIDSDIKLIINGKPNESLMQIINEYNLKEKVQFIGYVNDEDLPTLYNLSEMFIFPSLYEGFGLPPLEAMACGCPAIVSNTSSIPEVVGDGAFLVNPNNEKEIANYINTILHNSLIKKDIVSKGLNRVKYFSWEITGKQTKEIYEQYNK